MRSYHELVLFLENSGVMRFTERGLSSYLISAERMVKDAQARSGDFARMQDAQIAAVLGQLISHITRIVNTVPKDTDPKAVGIARKLLSLGGKAASVKKAFDDLSRSGAAIAARMTAELQGKYDMRFESHDPKHLDETAYGVFSNYLGSSMMPFVQSKKHELDRRTDELTKALARAHAQGAAGAQRDLGLPFAQVSLDGVEFRPHRGGVRKLLVRFNPNGTLGINADGKTVANSAALRDIGPLMAKIVGGGFA